MNDAVGIVAGVLYVILIAGLAEIVTSYRESRDVEAELDRSFPTRSNGCPADDQGLAARATDEKG